MCLRLPNRNRVKVTRAKEGLDIASDSCCQSRGLRRPINVNVYEAVLVSLLDERAVSCFLAITKNHGWYL